tara:strand:+ start:54 stop:314 length:261 start_codon:yes stop_codon:yes gene_type:complete
MCLFTKPKPSGGGFTPGVKPVKDTDTSLPQAKTLKPEKEVSDVSYGRGRKEQQQQKAQGARSLAINLPNATQPGAQTGGLNTTQQP